MTNQSTVSVCNLALLSIGARAQISSLKEDSPQAQACSTLFSFVFEQLARVARWNCLKQQVALTLIAAAQGTPENPDGTTLPLPPTPWLYSYLVPSNSLAIRVILPTFPPGVISGSVMQTTVQNNAATWIPGCNQGQIPFSVSYGTDSSNNPQSIILTNQTQAQAIYTVNQPNPVSWDSLFTSAFVASLAAYLVPALALDKQLMQIQVKVAEGAITQARVADGNESDTSQNREASWITARQGSGGYWWGDQGGQYNGYLCDMSWPG